MAVVRLADVLVSNVRPQGLQRLGLDYEALSRVNPVLIYCAAVGYGSRGPRAGKAVYDDLMQAASGIAGLFKAVDGTPRYAPVNICDRTVGLHVAIAVTSALYHRQRTGRVKTSKCRCSRPWPSSCWLITSAEPRSFLRREAWDIGGCCPARVAPMPPRMVISRSPFTWIATGASSAPWWDART